jgi:hypothetical protein
MSRAPDFFAARYGAYEDVDLNAFINRVGKNYDARVAHDFVDLVAAIVRNGGRHPEDTMWLGQEDLTAAFTGTLTVDAPSLLRYGDGKALFYSGRVNMITGAKQAGKTWLAILTAREVLQAGGRVLYCDMEDSVTAWRRRFHTLGYSKIDEHALAGDVVWASLYGVTEESLSDVVRKASGFDLLVIDVMNRLVGAMADGDVNNGANSVNALYDRLFLPVARAGTAVLILDHPSKSGQRRNASVEDMIAAGTALKLNHLDGLAVALKAIRPMSIEDPMCEIEVICQKDRHGHHRIDDVIAVMRGDVGNDEDPTGWALSVRDVTRKPEDREREQVQAVAEHIVTKLTSKNAVKLSVIKRSFFSGPSGKRTLVDEAVALLLWENRIVETSQGIRLRDPSETDTTTDAAFETDVAATKERIVSLVSAVFDPAAGTGITATGLKGLLTAKEKKTFDTALARLVWMDRRLVKQGDNYTPAS